MLLQPPKHVDASQPRHLQIQDNQVRERISATIGKIAFPSEISNRVNPIPDNLNGYADTRLRGTFRHSVLEEPNVVAVIFCQKDCKTSLHRCATPLQRRMARCLLKWGS